MAVPRVESMGRIQEFFKGNRMMDLGDFVPINVKILYCTNFNDKVARLTYFQDGAI